MLDPIDPLDLHTDQNRELAANLRMAKVSQNGQNTDPP